MFGWLLVLLAVTATWRLTWLVNEDTIAAPLRRWAARHDDRRVDPDTEPDEMGPWVSFLLCPWCVSMWVSAPIAAAVVLWPTNRLVWAVLIALTASLVSGMGTAILRGVLDPGPAPEPIDPDDLIG